MNKPTYLSKRASEVWDNIASKVDIDKPTIADMLSVYCEAVSEYEKATEELNSQSLVITTATGYQQPNPLIAIRNKASTIIRQFDKALQIESQSKSNSFYDKLNDE